MLRRTTRYIVPELEPFEFGKTRSFIGLLATGVSIANALVAFAFGVAACGTFAGWLAADSLVATQSTGAGLAVLAGVAAISAFVLLGLATEVLCDKAAHEWRFLRRLAHLANLACFAIGVWWWCSAVERLSDLFFGPFGKGQALWCAALVNASVMVLCEHWLRTRPDEAPELPGSEDAR